MPTSDVVIHGAREHNLRDVDVVLPRNQLICLTGVSGSGKSSLAFDTVFAEGQRRYVESLSSYARHFLGQMPKPDVDNITGLSPSISIAQKSGGKNPRSTVGTITEISDFLRVLFARVGQGFCPQCGQPITAQSREQILAGILAMPENTHFAVLAPLVRQQKGEYRDLFSDLKTQGFSRARVDGRMVHLSDSLQLDRRMRHDIEVVVDRLVNRPGVRTRLAEAVEQALKLGHGTLLVTTQTAEAGEGEGTGASATESVPEPTARVYSAHYACTQCEISFEAPNPQLFSFNSPQGMCPRCDGLGEIYSFDPELLIPDDRLSFKKGCVEILGGWKEMGRWRRHVYKSVASTIERVKELPPGTMLETPWRDLDPELQRMWLWGTGNQHVTFVWRGGTSPIKHGGRYDGVIPELMQKYRTSKSRPQLRKLEQYMRTLPCSECGGERLTKQARAVRITTRHPRFQDAPSRSLPQLCSLSISDAAAFFDELELNQVGRLIAAEALKEIRARLGFLLNVGLDYLTLARTAPTLSGGESQRIRLASQIGSGLAGVLYVLDEPSIGLHSRDNERLLDTLQQLRDVGNTVLVVEHDEETMRAADHVIDFGPGPGVRGGEVVAAGSADQIMETAGSITGQYLSGTRSIDVPSERREVSDEVLRVVGASHNNLKNVDVEIPTGVFVCVTGVSGSGKSSLVNDILVEVLRRDLNKGQGQPGAHRYLEGLGYLDKLIAIDQSPIGRVPRSNPATYIKVFDDIRKLFASLPESKLRGHKPGRFSFNVKGGRCEACKGNGANRLEMDFLADVWVDCPVCQGHRYNHETLQVQFKGKSIADVLEMDIQQALQLFENIPQIEHKLRTLHKVGLDYLQLGQPSPTLSGGEAQRIKLARELVKRSTGRTLYLLDEPTTGLHFADIQLLLDVLQAFVDVGNTVLVVEHHLDVIKQADWIVDLGPEGGEGGGRVVAAGTPEQVASCKQSHTGRALAQVLAKDRGGRAAGRRRKGKTGRSRTKPATTLAVQGAREHNLKSVHAKLERERMTVFSGPSGSGKSSLAMDTIYAEGQRRYVESLSAYARQFVAQMQKPHLDHIHGLSPAIAIEQRNAGHTPRSTVGTVTEIYDYLRILFSRLGVPYCPDCDVPIGRQTVDEIVEKVMRVDVGTRLYLLAPVEVKVGQDHETLWKDVQANGYQRVRVDGVIYSVGEAPSIDRRRKYCVEIVVDRVVVKKGARSRIAESVENALALGEGTLMVAWGRRDVPESQWETVRHSQHLACDRCGRSFESLAPHAFSFNSPLGWCRNCEGLGTETGANPDALLKDSKLTLAQGAVALWPRVGHPVSRWMLVALERATGIPLDVPFEQLSARHRRNIMHGLGDRWLDVHMDGKPAGRPPIFRYQFKGLYPALEEAARLSPALRSRLNHMIDEVPCSMCGGSRLRDDAAAVRFQEATIDELCRRPLGDLQRDIARWKPSSRDKRIAGELLREVKSRVAFLNDVGLEYLTLARGAATLSNGEAQRIRLASQLGSGLCGVLYVLDEPTIGLHPRDNRRLLAALHRLRDLGNTLIVVEHDREIIQGSDYICDFGPGAGKQGGEIVAQGTPRQLTKRRASVSGPFLSGKRAISIPENRRMTPKQKDADDDHQAETRRPTTADQPNDRGGFSEEYQPPGDEWLEVIGARHNNLCNIHARIPLGTLTVITGPSGSGKSSLVDNILYPELARRLHRAALLPGAHDSLRGMEHINKVIRVDQQPLGNSPTSNPATYTGVFELIRMVFAELPDAKIRGYSARRFSFNVPGGRCDRCEGNGKIRIEMHFLPDVWVECETCGGRRYNPETLAVTYRGRSISDVLEISCGDALELFRDLPKIRRILQTLCDVGLDYLALGQAAPTLSGGEAQRVKLAAELARPDTGRTLYLLDEPTTGLHFQDLEKLLEVLHRLVDLGNTVVVIEHNLDIIKSADWVIDLGPEAGEQGGHIVVAGTPEQVAEFAQGARQRAQGHRSHTGESLFPVLAAGPYEQRPVYDPAVHLAERPEDISIADVGQNARMPWEVDGRRWHTRDRVGRNGEPCKWDGKILERVVDRIQELGTFSDTDWNARSVVEIAAAKKSIGWFFHAITGETWLLKMKFRVSKSTFRKQEVINRFAFKTLNQMDELPIYGNQPRVRFQALRGPWQEVEINAHSWDEIDTPEFWSFLQEAVAGFQDFEQRTELKPEDHMPRKKLGKPWHFMRKGFPPGKTITWSPEVWETLHDTLRKVAPEGQFVWDNKVLVHLHLPGQREPWATIHTKRPESLDLTLSGPKGCITMGRVADLARDCHLDSTRPDRDLVHLAFGTTDDLQEGDLVALLTEHKHAVVNANEQQTLN
ncbi:MAG: excinuclease ABC subunit UvrA [Planctomycetota bacterium]